MVGELSCDFAEVGEEVVDVFGGHVTVDESESDDAFAVDVRVADHRAGLLAELLAEVAGVFVVDFEAGCD